MNINTEMLYLYETDKQNIKSLMYILRIENKMNV